MPNRGVLFAVTDEIADILTELPREKRTDYIEKDLEDMFFENDDGHTFELGEAWDTIHRVLAGGKLHWESGEYPLSHVVLGGQVLYGMEENDDYLIVFKTYDEVADISDALEEVTDEDFKKGYACIDMDDCGYKLGFENMEHALRCFERMKSFWKKAAQDKRAVLFAADL